MKTAKTKTQAQYVERVNKLDDDALYRMLNFFLPGEIQTLLIHSTHILKKEILDNFLLSERKRKTKAKQELKLKRNSETQSENGFDIIRQWAERCGIYEAGDVKTQIIKLQEEVGELANAILTENRNEVEDAIGDCVIVLTNLASLAEKHFCDKCQSSRGEESIVDRHLHWLECDDCGVLNIETCTNKAFNEIKNRTGKMYNGTFIKDK